MFNLPLQLVSGYHRAAETVLAIQRKEGDGPCGRSWSTLSSQNKDLLLSKQIRVVLQLTDKRLQELADVPSVLDVAGSPDQQAILKLIIARQRSSLRACIAGKLTGNFVDSGSLPRFRRPRTV